MIACCSASRWDILIGIGRAVFQKCTSWQFNTDLNRSHWLDYKPKFSTKTRFPTWFVVDQSDYFLYCLTIGLQSNFFPGRSDPTRLKPFFPADASRCSGCGTCSRRLAPERPFSIASACTSGRCCIAPLARKRVGSTRGACTRIYPCGCPKKR